MDVFPIIGIFTSFALYLSPFFSVIKYIKNINNSDNVINPIPISLALLNSSIWTKYSIVIDDIFLLSANLPGLIISIISVTKLLPYLKDHNDLKLYQFTIIFGLSIQILMYIILDLVNVNIDTLKLIYGIFAIIIFLFMCFSPLLTFKTIIKKKDSSSLYLPITMTQISNCTLWVIYGIYISDIFVLIPNLIGLLLGLIQLSLIILFNKKCKIIRIT